MFEKFRSHDSKTKWFVFNWVIYLLLLVITTIYCYARLDFVRTTPPPKENVK